MKECALKIGNGVSTWQSHSAETTAINSLSRVLLELFLCIQMEILKICEGITPYSVSGPLVGIWVDSSFFPVVNNAVRTFLQIRTISWVSFQNCGIRVCVRVKMGVAPAHGTSNSVKTPFSLYLTSTGYD